LTSIDEAKATIDPIPPEQWINVILGSRYTLDECLAEQHGLVDQLRTPIVRAHEIYELIKDARP
jgi:hypothetical protein